MAFLGDQSLPFFFYVFIIMLILNCFLKRNIKIPVISNAFYIALALRATSLFILYFSVIYTSNQESYCEDQHIKCNKKSLNPIHPPQQFGNFVNMAFMRSSFKSLIGIHD